MLEKHVDGRLSKSKLLEVLCMKKIEGFNKRECEICGKDLEALMQIQDYCQRDVELKVLIYRRFLRVPLSSFIGVRKKDFIGIEAMSPIFNKPINYY